MFFSIKMVRVRELVFSAGDSPALDGSMTSLPYVRANASAIGLLHMFPIHRKSTRLRSFTFGFSRGTIRALWCRRSTPGGTSRLHACLVQQARDRRYNSRAPAPRPPPCE